ncbi:hypothetical protein [Nocardia sp. NPDC057030]|uniref:DUF7239 family protein n=1 Tax=unclassified Nocardia TaxID=2637762 RepID=UPI00362E3E9F
MTEKTTRRFYVDSEAAQPILDAAKAAGYERRPGDSRDTVYFVVAGDEKRDSMRVTFTYNGRVQQCRINQVTRHRLGRDGIVKWFERERVHALAPAGSQLAAAYSAAKRHGWTEIYRDGGVTFLLADTTMRAEFSETGHLTGLDRTQGSAPREVPTDDAFDTLMTWFAEAELIIADERNAAKSTGDYYAYRDGDPREEKLPEWVQARLTRLRKELRYSELGREDALDKIEAMREAAELDPNDDTGIRYETEHGERYLPSGGTLHVRVGRDEIAIVATEDGIGIRTDGDGLAVLPYAFRDIEVRVVRDE